MKQRRNNSLKTQLCQRSMGRPGNAISSSTNAGKSWRKMKVPGAGGKEKASQGAAQPRFAAEFASAAPLPLWQLWWQDTAFGDLLCILQGGWSLCPFQFVKTMRFHKSSKIPESILVPPPPMGARRTLSSLFDSFFLCGDTERKYTFCLSLNASTFQRK